MGPKGQPKGCVRWSWFFLHLVLPGFPFPDPLTEDRVVTWLSLGFSWVKFRSGHSLHCEPRTTSDASYDPLSGAVLQGLAW